MPETDIGSTAVSDLRNVQTDYSVPSESTDGIDGNTETEWIMQNWNEYLGYYKNIPELQTAVDAKATWTIGAGFTADEMTTILLNNIKGHGKDSFNTILLNNIRVYTVGGDSFSEIIRVNDVISNLKPLDPSTIKVIFNTKGIIVRYEQIGKNKKVLIQTR